MAKKKVPFKYRPKQVMERQLKDRNLLQLLLKERLTGSYFLKSYPERIAKFFRDVVHELKRVTWPSRKTLFTYTMVVVIALIFFAVLLGIFDFVFLRLLICWRRYSYDFNKIKNKIV